MTYTLEQLNAMSDTDLQVIVAIMNGWRPSIAGNWAWQMIPPDGDGFHVQNCPKYSTDIATAYELEASVPAQFYEKYTNTLASVLGASHIIGNNPTSPEFVFAMIHASARVRCIAWILTMEGK